MSTAITVTAGTTPMIKLTYALNSMGPIITAEVNPICIIIQLRHTIEAATRVIPDES